MRCVLCRSSRPCLTIRVASGEKRPDSSSDDYKGTTVTPHYYDPTQGIDNQRDENGVPQLHSISEKKLLYNIDLHLIPVLSIMYLLAFLDRTNIANAAIFNLAKDLKINTTQYSTALTIFFVPYIIFEIPSNIILKKLKPHVWLSFCMFMFGVATICQGLVQNYGGLLTTRFVI